MIFIIDIEWRDFYKDILSIIIDEFDEGKELISIILLIIAEDAEILFEDLINMFDLIIWLWVIGDWFIALYIIQLQ